MRFFNPFAVWSQVPIASRLARAVRSVQFVTVTYASGAVTADATISALVGSGLIVPLGESNEANNAASGSTQVQSRWSISGTTVTATRHRGADAAGTNCVGTANCMVVDFA